LENIKDKTLKGVYWSSIERFSVQGIHFILSIIMARLLEPSDYGIIGMLAIFLAISQTFIDGGFSNALIRKQDRTEIDFSTVFYFNIGFGIFFYFILFFASPLIARFYKIPILSDITKILALNLLINSLSVVQRAKLTIAVDFKSQTKASVIAVIMSGFIGLVMVYTGFGVWALVFQSVFNTGLNMMFLWIFVRWKPLRVFSGQSFRELFSYGSKLLFANLLETAYKNINTIIIGKLFQATDLGFYTRAEHFAQFPSSNLTGIFQRVTFPILSSIQNNNEKLKIIYRKYLRMVAFIIFPLMCGLSALAKPLIVLVLTEKWLGVIPLLQLLCFGLMWYPVHAINMNILQVKGRSDLFFRLEIIKKIIGIVILSITISIGIMAMCVGTIVFSLICLIVNTYYTGKIISLGFFVQMKDILPILLFSLIMMVIAYLVSNLFENNGLNLVCGILAGATTYILMNIFIGSKELKLLFNLIKTQKKTLCQRL
jgi:O-antigen/teichoic acid export membrane protein